MTDSQRSEIRKLLREHGLSSSAPRIAIYDWLCSNPVHPTVDGIYEALRPYHATLSRTTVYNVLHAFVAHGLADAVRTEDLELRYDGNVHPHAHFKCTACGKVEDLEDIPRGIASKVGISKEYIVRSTALTLWGLCPACASAQKQPTQP